MQGTAPQSVLATPTRALEDATGRLDDALSTAERIALCLDFDGTLAPIVDDPATAEPLPATAEAVRSLEATPDVTTAIVSGRALSDVRRRIDGPSTYAGNHGLEIERHGSVSVHPVADRRAELVGRVCAQLDREFETIANCRVENKRLTGTVHLRGLTEATRRYVLEETRRTVATVGEGALTTSRGKRVVEVKPDVSWGKGNAVDLIESTVTPREATPSETLVIYVGDDTTDESAFRAVEPEGIGVRVGPSRASSASRHVSSPIAVAELLRHIQQTATN